MGGIDQVAWRDASGVMNGYVDVEVLVVGIGFSTIPLLKELDRTQTSYTIISTDPGGVWRCLDSNSRLDFDLVSSLHSSFYTYDLIKESSDDGYPTSKSFYAYHQRLLAPYKHKIMYANVLSISNEEKRSTVHLETLNNGIVKVICARKVVVATGFQRKNNSTLSEFNFDIEGKTIALTTMGDSANLMIAKLVPRNNRVIVISNGFFPLDKLTTFNGITYTLDQLEFQNLLKICPFLHKVFILGDIRVYDIFRYYSKIWRRSVGIFMDPRYLFNNQIWFADGLIAIKMWNIDEYRKKFGTNIEAAIKQGYLLNDLCFWVMHNKIELWKKSTTIIDNNTIIKKETGDKVRCDFIIHGDKESPRLPRIEIKSNAYQYSFHNCYLGVVPRELRNIFFIGFTRPTTGGVANITEMQCLLVHKLLTNDAFQDSIYSSIDVRISKHLERYYPTSHGSHCNHVKFYGTYVDEVASCIGIDLTMPMTIGEFWKWLIYPNCALKYRQEGEYALPGCKETVERIYRKHNKFFIMLEFMLFRHNCSLLNILSLSCLFASIGLSIIPFKYVTMTIFCMRPNLVTNYTVAYLKATTQLASFLFLFSGHKSSSRILLVHLVVSFSAWWLGLEKAPFNNVSVRFQPENVAFFEKYIAAYAKVKGPVRDHKLG
ncbi:hypothetical protein N9O24_00845 [bacterium]|nr:hypothetical protein [bacterium]